MHLEDSARGNVFGRYENLRLRKKTDGSRGEGDNIPFEALSRHVPGINSWGGPKFTSGQVMSHVIGSAPQACDMLYEIVRHDSHKANDDFSAFAAGLRLCLIRTRVI